MERQGSLYTPTTQTTCPVPLPGKLIPAAGHSLLPIVSTLLRLNSICASHCKQADSSLEKEWGKSPLPWGSPSLARGKTKPANFPRRREFGREAGRALSSGSPPREQIYHFPCASPACASLAKGMCQCLPHTGARARLWHLASC